METKTNDKIENLEELVKALDFCVLSYEWDKPQDLFGKTVKHLDAISDKKLAKAYWLLDKNAFGGGQPAPIFMKLDALIMGGMPVIMTLPQDIADPTLVNELEAQNLDDVPIGFMDLHYKGNGGYSVSGLGIAKQYQGKGLSKLLIYAGIKIAKVKKLIIPTQLSNASAHFAWMHLAPLKVVSADVFHNEPDTIIYEATIPKKPEELLKKHPKNKGMLIPFNLVKWYWEKYGYFPPVIGYQPGIKGGLYVFEKHVLGPWNR